MGQDQTFDILRTEFRRVGVEPDTFSAMLALRPEDALRALRVLPDGAGPTAFLAQLRENGNAPAAQVLGDDSPSLDKRRRDKSA